MFQHHELKSALVDIGFKKKELCFFYKNQHVAHLCPETGKLYFSFKMRHEGVKLPSHIFSPKNYHKRDELINRAVGDILMSHSEKVYCRVPEAERDTPQDYLWEKFWDISGVRPDPPSN